MSAKSIISIVLLLFVAASVIYLAAGSFREPVENSQTVTADPQGDGLIVYYLHQTKRCATCNKLEELAAQTMHERFASNLNDESIRFKVINFEMPENSHFADEYQLVTQSIIVQEVENGTKVRWKNLEKIWELVWKEEEFLNYVESEIRAYLEQD